MSGLNLRAPQPFSLTAVVASHGWIQLAPFAQDAEGDGFCYVSRLASGRVVEIRVRAAPSGVVVDADGLLGDAEQAEIADSVTWMLGLEQSFEPFYALARQEPRLAQMAARAQGRLLRSATLFEDTVKTILTTNTAWSGTIRMVNALVANCGDPLANDPSRRAFPTPARLADAGEAALRKTGGLGYRAPYVSRLASDIVAGALDLEALRAVDMPTVELRERLLAIKGVGNYAAAHMLLILGHYDFVPIDSWALKMVSREWYDGAPVGRAEVEAAFERWGRWRGLAYWFWDWAEHQTESA